MTKHHRYQISGLILFALLFFTFNLSAQDQPAEKSENTSVSEKEKASFERQFKEAQKFAKEEKWLDAQRKARELINSVPSDSARQDLFQLLSQARFHLLFSKKQTDTSERYEVQSGDTLGRIAGKKGTTVELLRKTNKIKKDVVWVGMKLKVEKVPFSVEISIPQNVLWLKQGKHFVKKYQVSTGEKGNTPVGSFKIANKVVNPTWYHDDEVVLPGDPKNGLGARWMGFDLKGYGIHGTIEPKKIGKPASLGCVRMRNEDVEELFDLIPIGTPVTITK